MSQLSDYRDQVQASADGLSLAMKTGRELGLITKVQIVDDGTAQVRIYVEDTKIAELTAEPTP